MDFLEHIASMDAKRASLIVQDFARASTWINTEPLSFTRELKGKIVVLDFWAFCCINCMHTLQELKILERKYAKSPVVFIGVHSAKFANEQIDTNVLQAVRRYSISHPVVNDPKRTYWQNFGVSAWPTLVVLGPYANLLASFSGEGNRDILDDFLQKALLFYGPEGKNVLKGAEAAIEQREEASKGLCFPGKVFFDPKRERLYVADSANNRVVITDETGTLFDVIGSGKRGFKDASFSSSSFAAPQGLFVYGDGLYVADTENHAIRYVDLTQKTVTTILGTGEQGRDLTGGRKGNKQPISSPWDLLVYNNMLFIAMAGVHQIWTFDLTTHIAKAYSGTGHELHLNAENPLEAAWAQPSGLARMQDTLFVADSESSSIRALNLVRGNSFSLAGGDWSLPQNLFSFGDTEGVKEQAKLQHPIGITFRENTKQLIIADSYNHRLKVLDPFLHRVLFWVGSGKQGHIDGAFTEATFWEPSGLAWAEKSQKLFVADTNNHSVRVVDCKKACVTTLSIEGL